MQKKKVVLPRATLDIYNYEENGCNIYEFDATECTPPEPMVNTIVALEMIKSEKDRLKVTFFHEPMPLYERISEHFNYFSEELESGDYLVTISKKIL